MRATAEPVDGNRVRLSVEIDEAEIDDVVSETSRRLARQIRVPGFRPGKVPRRVLEARLGGPGVLREQAISDALPDLYARAVVDTELDPIAAPEIDITSGKEGGAVSFDAMVEVRPQVSIPGYQGLLVTVPSPDLDEAAVDAQVDRLREQSGELSEVSRPARDGDALTIDLHGTRAGGDDLDVTDFLYEVGSGSDVPGLDDQLRGARAGDILQFSAPLPGAESDQPSVDGSFRVLVKEVKEKILPEVNDEWAAEVSEFDTADELLDDLRDRLTKIQRLQAQLALREGALEALIGLLADDPPRSLVDAEVRERLHDLGHRLESRRMSVQQFLEASGRTEDQLMGELTTEADRAVRVDLALRALADAEDLQVDEDELETAIAEMAAQVGSEPAELRERLDRAGRLQAVRSDRRKSKALEWLLDNVELVDGDGNPVSREDLQASDTTTDGTATDSEDRGSGATSSPPGGSTDEDGGDRQGDDDVRTGEQPTVEVES
jgi:trigger factor